MTAFNPNKTKLHAIDSLPPQEVSVDVLLEKYSKGPENIDQIRARVARGLASVEKEDQIEHWQSRFIWAMENGFIPAGRINSAAGTGIKATLINCFVQPVGDAVSEDKDGKPSIYKALAQAAETMRRGGGVGYNFSSIRPKNAKVKGTQSMASGPISYMHVFDQSCATVESAGARRGAQMGMMNSNHPDVMDFIREKSKKGALNNFNVSVAVSDGFMRAVQDDLMWDLVHKAEPNDELIEKGAYQREDGLWVYSTVRATEMWNEIMLNTYNQAEPGIIFIDKVNNDNNMYYAETIEATNPCVTGDTWVMTSKGARQVSELIETPFHAVVDGGIYPSESRGFYYTGHKEVFQLSTKQGYSVKVTGDHPIRVLRKGTSGKMERVWVNAAELKPGERIVLQDHREHSQWDGDGTRSEGYLLGLLMGDGTIKEDKTILSVWDNYAPVEQKEPSVSAASVMNEVLDAVKEMPSRSDFNGWQAKIAGRREFRLSLGGVRQLAEKFGMSVGAKGITPTIERSGSEFHRGFLRGFFDADGSVQGSVKTGLTIRLAQSDVPTLEAAQRMLSRLGIPTTLYAERRPAGERILPDGNGGSKAYFCKANAELVIRGRAHLERFMAEIGFADIAKTDKIQRAFTNYTLPTGIVNPSKKTPFECEFIALSPLGTENVYDCTIKEIHAFCANGVYISNCGEQPLPAYGCCCLGSLNLALYVTDPFGDAPSFDFEKMASVVKVGVRMLDNVLDVTHWPLPEQYQESRNKRRVGLGYTALGNALAMMKIRYNTEAGLEFCRQVTAAMRDAAYEASSEIAADKGSFLLFDAEKYLASQFAMRLPERVRASIRKNGMRNSHLLSIAPTGTISLAFADNASNGIEPPFSYFYNRRKREQDGTWRNYSVEDHAWRLYKAMGGDTDNLPDYFVTALEMSAIDHMNMVAAAAPFIDSAISKCVLKGTRIMTNKGLLKVEDLGHATQPDTFASAKPGLKTLCPDGQWRSIRQHYFGGVRPTVKIRTTNGQTITGSDQHRLKTTSGWTRMSELAVGDWIMVRRNALLNCEGGAALPASAFAHNAKQFKTPTHMSPNLALFLGMICSDGHLLERAGRVALHQNHLPSGEKFKELAFELFGVDAKHSVDPRTGVHCHMFNSRAICRWIKQLVGYRCYDKHAPEAIFAGSPAEMKSFLSGLTLDGYKVTQGGRESTALYEGRSKQLAQDAFSLLVALGFQPRLTDKTVTTHGYKTWGVRATGVDFSLEPHKNSAPSAPNEYVAIPDSIFDQKLSSTSTPYYARRGWHMRGSVVCKEEQLSQNFPETSESEMIFFQITDVETGHGEVYDIEVEESHDYLVDGIVSHNTVNVPEDYPYADFTDLYMQAWKSGLKGIATYRPNATLGAVLSVAPAKEEAKPVAKVEDFSDEANRRIHIKNVPEPVLGSLRWPDRPQFAAGNTAWTYMVDHPEGEFALFLGEAAESEIHDKGEAGKRAPFEVWIQGRKAPRGLGAIAKTLSIDLRSADKGWIYKKLNALAKTAGETPFAMRMPPEGEEAWMSSASQAVAKLILWRCEQLGAFETEDPTPEHEKQWINRTPLLDSLFSDKEPKTGPGGTMGWCADVLNPATNDDFVLGLKEITLPDGSHRPYSMWMSGNYPKALDGLCKLISLDMRVMDPAWIGLKLRKLTTYAEPLGEFMAKIPGNELGKMQTWPSTVSYVAALVLHRYQQLGILGADGRPTSEMGVMVSPGAKSLPAPAAAKGNGGVALARGKVCPSCSAPAMIKKDGCEFCTACGHIGSCG